MPNKRIIHFKTGTAILDGSASPDDLFIDANEIKVIKAGKGQSFLTLYIDGNHSVLVQYRSSRARDKLLVAIRDYMTVEDKKLEKVDWYNGEYMSV